MKQEKRALSRALAYLLTIIMIFGCLSIPGWSAGTAYAAFHGSGLATENDYVTVRIEGNHIGADGTNNNVGTVLNETIVYLKDLVSSPTAIDAVNRALQNAGLTQGEKSGSGVYTTFGAVGVTGKDYWRFSINDEGAAAGLDTQAIANHDRIVLDITDGDWTSPTFNNVPKYSYFKVVNCNEGIDYGYPKADIKLALYQLVYDLNTWSASAQPVAGATITGTGSWNPVTTDDENGIAAFTLWGTTTGAATYCFDISSDQAGLTRPYCQIVMKYDGINAPAVYITQPPAADTSLKGLTLAFPDTAATASGINYLNNSVLTVGNGVTSVSLGAIDLAAGASAAVRYQPAGGSFGSEAPYSESALYDLSEGENIFKIRVSNGSDQEVYKLVVKRSTASDTAAADVAAVISGIRDVNDTHAAAYYNNDWALGMAAAGLNPTADEKAKYLANVLNLAADASTSVSTIAKTAVALTSWNIDARQVPDKNGGQAVNLIDRVAGDTGYIDPAYTAPFILSLYDLRNYEIPKGAVITREALIDNIIASQEADGSWYGAYGADATGMVLPALAPYYGKTAEVNGISAASCAAVTAAIDKALLFLSNSQGIDGSFPGYGGAPNSNTMIAGIVGINSLGINPNSDSRFVKSGRSVLQNLLTYRTGDDKLGYKDSSAANDLACQQGLGALATYQNLGAARGSNLYHFAAEIAPYTNWPDADLLTSIKVTPPTNTVYSYDSSVTSYSPDTDGMIVTGIYNGNASNTINIPVSSCTVSKINRASEGTQTVTVSYQGNTATFMVTVKKGDVEPTKNTVSVKVKSKTVIASDNSVVIEAGKTTVLDVLKTVLDNAGISYLIVNKTYVSEIDGLGEFDQGANSGWMYSVNGDTPPTTASSEYVLQPGDSVLWYYTLDYTKDTSSSEFGGGAVTETAGNSGIADIKVACVVNASGKAAVSISSADINAAIAGAVASAAKAGADIDTEVRITVEGAQNASSVEVTLPKASIADLKAKIDRMTIRTAVASISLDADTIAALVKELSGDIKITASKLDADQIAALSEKDREEIGDKPVFDFTIQSGNKTISAFNGKIKITVPYTAEEQELAGGLIVYYISDNGKLEMVRDCVYDSKSKTLTFVTGHLSKYAVGYRPVSFADIANHWGKDYIEYLAARDVLDGMTKTTFAPNNSITRAQFVQILANLSGDDLNSYEKGTPSSFHDIPKNAWYSKAVAWACDKEVVKGISRKDGSLSFDPNARISRQDMAVMIARYTEKIGGYELLTLNAPLTFSDESQISGYAKDAVLQLQRAGLLNGKADGVFAPKDDTTRAESAKMISILIENSL